MQEPQQSHREGLSELSQTEVQTPGLVPPCGPVVGYGLSLVGNVALGRQLPVAKGTAQRGTRCEPSAGSAPSTRRRNVSVLQLELAGTPQRSLLTDVLADTIATSYH